MAGELKPRFSEIAIFGVLLKPKRGPPKAAQSPPIAWFVFPKHLERVPRSAFGRKSLDTPLAVCTSQKTSCTKLLPEPAKPFRWPGIRRGQTVEIDVGPTLPHSPG